MRKRWLAYQGNGITDWCVPWESASVTWGKCWLLFSTKAFLLVQIAVGREAKQRTRLHMHSGSDAAHIERRILSPREFGCCLNVFWDNIGPPALCCPRFCAATSGISRSRSSRFPTADCSSVGISHVHAGYLFLLFMTLGCMPDQHTRINFRCIAWNWLLVATVVCTLSVTRAMLTSIWSKWNTDHTVGIQYHNRALSTREKVNGHKVKPWSVQIQA